MHAVLEAIKWGDALNLFERSCLPSVQYVYRISFVIKSVCHHQEMLAMDCKIFEAVGCDGVKCLVEYKSVSL